MAEVRISKQARVDLEHIRTSGIERFGIEAVGRHLHEIGQCFGLLADHPLAGQERPEFRQSIRSVSRRPHCILYTVNGDAILIVRVIHQARDVGMALRGET